MGLVYVARRFAAGVEKWEVVGPPGVGVNPDELDRLGITNINTADVATDLSTHLFVENGNGDGVYVFDLQPSGFADPSERPELHFGRNGHDGLYHDGALLWTLDVESYEWGQHAYTLTLRAYDPASRTNMPDPLPADSIADSCGIKGPVHVEDIDDPGSLLLPDLVSCPTEQSSAEIVSAPDGAELYALRFAGYVTNLGAGPLDLKGNPQLADDADPTSHEVRQRALTGEGEWVNLSNKPPIIFQRDDGHNHFHVMGIVEYSLWDASGTVEVSPGLKVGFCVSDMRKRSDLHPNPGPQRYEWTHGDLSHFCETNQPDATTLHMGISEGWQEVYAWNTTFQWVDVSDVRPGYYRLGHRADPENVIVESDETNNGLKLSHSWHVVPGYVAKPATVRVDPGATVRFKLSADEYFDDGSLKDESTRAHRIVTQPSHGRLDVNDTITVTIDGANHQAFTDEWVTYTPDPGYVGSDSFTFVALDETRPGYPINPVVAKVTLHVVGLASPASGAPIIQGIAAVGRILTANTSEISDPNGVDNTTYNYQWIRNDGTTDMEIPGATSFQYPLTIDDLGSTIAVRVNFRDDLGFLETLTSSHTFAVASLNQPASGAPEAPGKPEGRAVFIGGVDLEWDDVPGADAYRVQQYWGGQWVDLPVNGVKVAFYGAGAIISGLDPESSLWFRVSAANGHGDSDWSGMFFMNATGEYTSGKRPRPDNEPATGAPVIMGVAQVGETLWADTTGIWDGNGLERVHLRYQWMSDDGNREINIAGATRLTYQVQASDLGAAIRLRVSFVDRLGYAETLSSAATAAVAARPNIPATGAPVIMGTAKVGETLSADISGIDDDDGFTGAVIEYQWVRNNGVSDTDITGATDAAYTLAAVDGGNTIKVRVSFTDDAGYKETLTSAPTAEVEALPNTPATGQPTISGTVQVGETLTADTSGIGDADGLTNVFYSYQWVGNYGTADTDIAGATNSTYTLTTDDEGNTIKIQVSFTDDGGNTESLTSAPTGTVETRPNSPATGQPTISGTVQVGKTLTADTSGISDTDGLSSVSYSYQWLADGSAIAGATGSTYTLTDGEEGQTVSVRVSFTDDAGNEESLTSAPTGTVEAQPNSPATGAPEISGTVQVGETLTVSISGIGDSDGLTNVSYSYQWVANDGTADTDIAGATNSTYTVAAVDEGNTIKVRVSFTDDAGNDEELTSTGTEHVDNASDTDDASNSEPEFTRNGIKLLVLENVTEPTELRKKNAGHSFTAEDADGDTLTYSISDAEPDSGDADSFTVNSETGQLTTRQGATFDFETKPRYKVLLSVHDGKDTLGGSDTRVDDTMQLLIDVENEDEPGSARIHATNPNVWPVVFSYSATDEDGILTTLAPWWYRGESIDGEFERIEYANGAIHHNPTYTTTADDVGKYIRIRARYKDGHAPRKAKSVVATWQYPVQADNEELSFNSPATGAPEISGTAQVGETLTADTSGIADADGLSSVSYSYQWLADGADIVGATAMTYTLTDADEGAAVKVRVSFTDDRGNEEELTSAATGTVEARPNSPATGAPEISGTAQVGETLTVSISGIGDADGLTNASHSYQWVANDGTADTDIAGATNSTYTVAAVDEGNTIKVRVSFTDDAGNDEGLTSTATDTVKARPNSPASGRPSISGTARVGETLTAATSVISDTDGLSSVSYSYQWLADGTDIVGATAATYTLTDAEEGAAIKVRVSFTDDAGNEESLTSAPTGTVEARPNSPATGAPEISGTEQVGETLTADASGISDQDGLSSAVYQFQWLADGADIAGATATAYTLTDAEEGAAIKVRVSFTDDEGNEESLTSAPTHTVEARPNSPATGQPSISGTAQVGETLTADTSGISDADGLSSVSFSHQWLADGADIAGAIAATYTLTDADEGAAIKVRVSFTDDAGYEESLTSAPTDTVEARPNSPASGRPTISGTVQIGETLTADASGISDQDGLSSAVYQFQWLADGADIAGATATAYTLTDAEEGAAIKVRVSFTDDEGNDESLTSAPTDPVEARPNSPASGQPTISGTAQVGETLTVSISGIGDADGLSSVSYSYQWLADGADIAGATAATYTLTDADLGAAIKVRVSFTDDAGNEEELTSAPTGTVGARPNTPASGQPTISGTVQVGETLTADTSGISDIDGLSGVSFSYQWLADGADITGATAATYTLTDADLGAAIKVRVSFTDDAGNDESLTSAATKSVVVPLTASLHDVPQSHDGHSPFTFELRFSEELKLSYKKLKNNAFTVTGGTIQRAQRIVKSSNIRWRITVAPDSDSPVRVFLPATTRCGAQGGICASGGRKLSNNLDLIVSGPGE